MAEVKKGEGLVYKNHPLRRVDNLIYYGSMSKRRQWRKRTWWTPRRNRI